MISLGTYCEDESSDLAALETLVSEQMEAWNRNDLKGFLACYSMSKDLTCTNGSKVVRGFDSVRHRYSDGYEKAMGESASDSSLNKIMGVLEFDAPLQIVILSSESAWALGSFKVCQGEYNRTIYSTSTLVFRRTAGHLTRWNGWRIVHDHTSMRDKAE